MTGKQINKRRMYDAVILALGNNLSIIEAIPELVTAHQELKEKIMLIDQQSQIQEADNTGLTKNKNQLRTELIVLLHRIVLAMTACATTKKDVVLKEKVNYTITDLRRKQDSILYALSSMTLQISAPICC